jgi:hypothetical protein
MHRAAAVHKEKPMGGLCIINLIGRRYIQPRVDAGERRENPLRIYRILPALRVREFVTPLFSPSLMPPTHPRYVALLLLGSFFFSIQQSFQVFLTLVLEESEESAGSSITFFGRLTHTSFLYAWKLFQSIYFLLPWRFFRVFLKLFSSI